MKERERLTDDWEESFLGTGPRASASGLQALWKLPGQLTVFDITALQAFEASPSYSECWSTPRSV
jgi:hypothetical protein